MLFVVNPSESSRFLAIGMVVYHVPVFLFVLSAWLYVKSYLLGLRSLLALSTMALCASALCYESVLPISFFVPVLLLLIGPRPKIWVWLAHWWGLWVVLAGRFFLFMTTTAISYQRYLAQPSSLRGAPASLGVLAHPTLAYVEQPPSSILSYVGLASCALATVAVWREPEEHRMNHEARSLLKAVIVAFSAVFLGILPYLGLPMTLLRQVIHSFATFRTQYYAAPGQAVLYAVLLGLIAVTLPHVAQRPFMSVAAGLLAGVTAGVAFDTQRRPLRDEAGGVFLGEGMETVARLFREVDRLAPKLDGKTSVFFVLGGGMRTPFGPDYDLLALSCSRLGVPAYAGVYSQGRGWIPRRNFGSPEKEQVVAFSGTVKAFKLTPEGGIAPFVPRGDTVTPTQVLDASIACETWTIPSVLFRAEGALWAAPFDRAHRDFLHVAPPFRTAR
jgi:hypothetical protein